jgi:hypothetical protein
MAELPMYVTKTGIFDVSNASGEMVCNWISSTCNTAMGKGYLLVAQSQSEITTISVAGKEPALLITLTFKLLRIT